MCLFFLLLIGKAIKKLYICLVSKSGDEALFAAESIHNANNQVRAIGNFNFYTKVAPASAWSASMHTINSITIWSIGQSHGQIIRVLNILEEVSRMLDSIFQKTLVFLGICG